MTTEPPMSLDRARAIVLLAERNQGDNALYTDGEVLRDVVDRLSLATLTDYGDEESVAYEVFLAHHQDPTREQLIELLRAATAEGQPELTPAQRVWLEAAERGELR